MSITLTELKTDFGTYIATKHKDILKSLVQPTVSQNFMRTIASKDLEWRAAQAVIDDLVQGFQKGWTPKGGPTFTPISLVQRRHKADLVFYPDDVFESWLGFLTDEKKDRKDWPITRYIIEQLMLPKINDNRELKLIGKGIYEAVVADTAQATGKSMDGFLTVLKYRELAGDSNINFFDGGAVGDPTAANIVDFVEAFVDWIAFLYQGIQMNLHCSPSWLRAYKRKYRETYGTQTDFDGVSEIPLESNVKLVALPSMAGSDVFFCTPKENFIRLINANEGASKINVESEDRKM